MDLSKQVLTVQQKYAKLEAALENLNNVVNLLNQVYPVDSWYLDELDLLIATIHHDMSELNMAGSSTLD